VVQDAQPVPEDEPEAQADGDHQGAEDVDDAVTE